MKKAFWKNVALGLGGVGIPILAWLIAWIAVGNELIVPNLFLCLKKSVLLLFDGAFWLVALGTLKRVFIAFFFSLIFALVFAFVAYLSPSFEKIFAPIIGVFRAVPIFGVLLIILVWTKDASTAPIIVAFLSLFPILYTESSSALKGVDKDLIEMSRVYKVPIKKQIICLYLPTALPHILRSGGASLSFGVKLIVSAEVLARTANSLGNSMQELQILETEMSTLFALILLSCVLAFALETVFTALSRLVKRREK